MPRFMFHVTLRCRVASILRRGLLGRYATQKRLAVWVVHPDDLFWALAHTSLKPFAKGQKLSIIRIDTRGLKVKRHGKRALWIDGDVAADRLAVVEVTVGGKKL